MQITNIRITHAEYKHLVIKTVPWEIHCDVVFQNYIPGHPEGIFEVPLKSWHFTDEKGEKQPLPVGYMVAKALGKFAAAGGDPLTAFVTIISIDDMRHVYNVTVTTEPLGDIIPNAPFSTHQVDAEPIEPKAPSIETNVFSAGSGLIADGQQNTTPEEAVYEDTVAAAPAEQAVEEHEVPAPAEEQHEDVSDQVTLHDESEDPFNLDPGVQL
jgi:hypothetical protein